MHIHLGYEILTGRPVSIPVRHMAVTGQTQLSGKTSTLEALITRARVKSVAFITKRGERGFENSCPIPVYFEEHTDWQSVEAMLEVTMGEKMKTERPWIIRLCHGAKTLEEVHANVKQCLKSTRGRIYELLNAYLEIVLAQIKELPTVNKLELKAGINVMDLRKYSPELQALIIASTIDWVYEHEQKVITIIPESWKFVPQDSKTPVLRSAEKLIREGAALENYIWLDSQDLAAVNKKILRSVGVYILGVQKELNEVARTLEHIDPPRPGAEEIKQLGIGQFFVRYESQMFKVYVQPTWADEEEARLAALSGGGIIPPPKR